MKEKKPTLKEKKNIPLDNGLKKRVLEVKEKLPKSGVSSMLLFKYPELDTVKGRSLVNNVLQLRQTDQAITEKLEALASALGNINVNDYQTI